MKRILMVALGLVLGTLAAVAGIAVAGRTVPAPPTVAPPGAPTVPAPPTVAPPGAPTVPPAARDPGVPSQPIDLGIGEELIVVVGGVFESKRDAEAANEQYSFGELQGYYVVPLDQFQGLREALGQPHGMWGLVSAFRTEAGAQEFAKLAGFAGAPATIVRGVVSRGGQYAGLGQEANPDGSGPLTRPLESEG